MLYIFVLFVMITHSTNEHTHNVEMFHNVLTEEYETYDGLIPFGDVESHKMQKTLKEVLATGGIFFMTVLLPFATRWLNDFDFQPLPYLITGFFSATLYHLVKWGYYLYYSSMCALICNIPPVNILFFGGKRLPTQKKLILQSLVPTISFLYSMVLFFESNPNMLVSFGIYLFNLVLFGFFGGQMGDAFLFFFVMSNFCLKIFSTK